MILRSNKIKFSVLAAFAFLFFCSFESIFAQRQLPSFKDYPVAKIYKGKNAPLRLTQLTRLEKELYGENLQ